MLKAPAFDALQTKLRFKSFCHLSWGGGCLRGGGTEGSRAISSTRYLHGCLLRLQPTALAW